MRRHAWQPIEKTEVLLLKTVIEIGNLTLNVRRKPTRPRPEVSLQEQFWVMTMQVISIICHLCLLSNGVRQHETNTVSVWWEIVSWPSIPTGLHASQNLAAIYSTVAPKKLGKGWGSSSIGIFHLCSAGRLSLANQQLGFTAKKKKSLNPCWAIGVL